MGTAMQKSRKWYQFQYWNLPSVLAGVNSGSCVTHFHLWVFYFEKWLDTPCPPSLALCNLTSLLSVWNFSQTERRATSGMLLKRYSGISSIHYRDPSKPECHDAAAIATTHTFFPCGNYLCTIITFNWIMHAFWTSSDTQLSSGIL